MPDAQIDCLERSPARHLAGSLRYDGQPQADRRYLKGLNKLILASSRDCIIVLDLAANYLFISPGGIESIELSDSDALIGPSYLRLWQGEQLAAVTAALAAARAGGVGRFEGFCPTRRGTPKWWDVVISPLPGPDGRPARLLLVGREITGRFQAQARLVASEEMLHFATENAGIGTWCIDIATGVVTRSEREAAIMHAPSAGTYDLADFYARVHPDDRAATAEALASAQDPVRRATCEMEFRIIDQAGGPTRWIASKGCGVFSPQGRCIRIAGTTIDITARKVAEAQLRASEAQLRELNATLAARIEERTRERDRAWNNSLDLQVVLDVDGRYRALNAAWMTVLGWAEADLVGRHIREFIHPDDMAGNGPVFAAVLNGERRSREVRYRHRDGSYRWIWWVSVIKDGMIYCNGRHITAQKEAAAGLAATQEKLRQSQKMEAVGQLTGGLAHDFNNLLTGIFGSLEMMQTRLAQGRLEKLERYITMAQASARRAAALTQRLLAFSRRQTLAPRPTDVTDLVAGMTELLRRTVGPAVAIDVAPAVASWPALVDPHQLENALLNLCINARDAMPDGGRLTIAIANLDLKGAAAADLQLPAGHYLALDVTDTGSGMTEEVLACAFDPFFTTKPMGQGTGLGLSMIYGFARQSGGHAHIMSQPGRGTSVCLYLPCHFGAADIIEAPACRGAISSGLRAGTVLVVDDEASVRGLVAEVLAEAGYTIIEAEDGCTAVTVLQSDRHIDLLVTDIGLPGGMNGRQVAEAGRLVRPGLRVLFITGYAETAVIGNGQLEQGTQLLTKPFLIEALMTKVSQLTQALVS